MTKIKKPIQALSSRQERHEPLGQVIQNDETRKKYAAGSRRAPKKKGRRNENNDDDHFEDEKSSRRIVQLSREQKLEIESEDAAARYREQQQKNRKNHEGIINSSDEEDNDEEDEEFFLEDQYVEHDKGYVSIIEGAEGLSPEDEAIVASMMNNNGGNQNKQTLADIIMEKIEEHEAIQRGEYDEQDGGMSQLPPKVIEVYTEIGKILSRYTSGKLPKAFKIIPSLSNWEDVLVLTRPDKWTPQAMYAATRIFASNLNPKMAQRFYNLILLEAVRDDIARNKKLNYHYYLALKKAVYKPSSFFKGVLLPLCQPDNGCTLREAAIIASVLQRVSIPVHHSAVAIHKLAQLRDYNGAASIFLKTMLNKKYSLPAPVIESVLGHFVAFLDFEPSKSCLSTADTLPVLWHQSLLVFVQRYKNEIRDGPARESLKLLMKKHYHPKITREIRRELFGAQAWKDERNNNDDENSDSMEQ